MSEESKSLFEQAMQDVTPLKPGEQRPLHDANKTKQSSKDLVRKIKKRQHQPPRSSANSQLDDSVTTSKVSAFDSISYSQKGVRSKELTALKKGELKIQSELDLHGMTADQAQATIQQFIAICYADKERVIRIIHGKGYNSNEELPVLKNLTNQILRQMSEVIAFSSAPVKDGGVGAVNVLLKAQ